MLKFSGSSEPTSGLEWGGNVAEAPNAKTPPPTSKVVVGGVSASEQMLEMTEAKHHALLETDSRQMLRVQSPSARTQLMEESEKRR